MDERIENFPSLDRSDSGCGRNHDSAPGIRYVGH
jgi:hypothetical protein